MATYALFQRAIVLGMLRRVNQFEHLGRNVDFDNMRSRQLFQVSTTFFNNIFSVSTTFLNSNNIFRQHFQQQFPRFLTTFYFFDNIFSTTFSFLTTFFNNIDDFSTTIFDNIVNNNMVVKKIVGTKNRVGHLAILQG